MTDVHHSQLGHHPVGAEIEPDAPMTDQQRIRVLEAGHRLLVAQQAEVAVTLRSVQTELSTNSAVTVEVRDILSAARGAFKFFGWLGLAIKWVGGIAAACTSLYVLAYMATHGGKPPGA